jgi:RimJ/RimL family protein N-acetyltransferase/acyl carrier protein
MIPDSRLAVSGWSEALDGRTVVLRPLIPADVAPLYMMAVTGRAGVTWRLRGQSVSPEAFAALLWEGQLAQHVIAPRSDPAQVWGLISLINHDPIGRIAYLSVLVRDDLAGTSSAVGEALVLAISHGFETFDLRKIYAETTALSMISLDRLVERHHSVVEEGRLRDHVIYAGSTWDLIVLAVYRDAFSVDAEALDRFIRRASPPTGVEIGFDEFAAALSHLIGVDGHLTGGTRLVDDLEFDSLALLEAVVACEDRFGCHIESVERIETLQDLYEAVRGEQSPITFDQPSVG